jgi:hypothetical protein
MNESQDGQRVAAVDPESLTGVARDASTITDVLRTFESDGFRGQFIAREDGLVECTACHERTAASTIAVAQVRRLEGASDPDDMLAVAALVCPSCGTRGTVVLGYGPVATIEDADVLFALDGAPAPEPGDVEQPRDTTS